MEFDFLGVAVGVFAVTASALGLTLGAGLRTVLFGLVLAVAGLATVFVFKALAVGAFGFVTDFLFAAVGTAVLRSGFTLDAALRVTVFIGVGPLVVPDFFEDSFPVFGVAAVLADPFFAFTVFNDAFLRADALAVLAVASIALLVTALALDVDGVFGFAVERVGDFV